MRKADQFLKDQGIEARKFITLTIRTSVQGFIDQKREEAHAAKLRALVVRWVESTGTPETRRSLQCSERPHGVKNRSFLAASRGPFLML